MLSYSGHIASLVNPPGNPKAHFFAGPEPEPDPDAWQAKAQKVAGTWWEHWADWAIQRSGDTRRSPTSLGSRKYPRDRAGTGRLRARPGAIAWLNR